MKKVERPAPRETNLSFPLPQHRPRGRHPSTRRPIPALGGLGVAASMKDPGADPDGVHPDPLLCVVVPDRLEPLLAYRAGDVRHGRVVGHGNVLLLGRLQPYRVRRAILGVGACGPLGGFGGAGFVDVVAGFDPFLGRSGYICVMCRGGVEGTYHQVHIPTPVLAAFGSVNHSDVDLKVPVEVLGFLPPAFVGSWEASTACCALVGSCFVKAGDQMRARATKHQERIYHTREERVLTSSRT